VENRDKRLRTVADLVTPYLKHYPLNHRARSVIFAKQRLAQVIRLLEKTLVVDLTEDRIRDYIKTRLEEGAGGRTVNMELGELSRALGHKWSVLWPKVRKLEERQDVGRALGPEEEGRLLEEAARMRSPLIGLFVRVALLTGMRAGEITSLTWGQVDLVNRILTVGKAKTASGTGRQIPMNAELLGLLAMHAQWFQERFGELKPGYYVFPTGKGAAPTDPTRPVSDITTAWDRLRRAARVQCRLHDLRHTAATKMAEAGVSEGTMLALLGHMSRAMLERYSHVRLTAKREAVEALSTAPGRAVSVGVSTISATVEEPARIQ
jgi:integrase